MWKTRIDLTGQKFNRLTVMEYAGTAKDGHAKWRCKCDCGNEIIASGNALKRNNTKSCGCYNREASANRIVSLNTTHGGTHTKLFRVWGGMKNRCYNANAINYCDYGARGITICDEWLNDFGAFQQWAIANGYNENLSIDRIDNNGNYEPSNCRWATAKQQGNNRRSTRYYEYKGETHTTSEWAEMYSIPHLILQRRLHDGWDFEQALTAPRYAKRES